MRSIKFYTKNVYGKELIYFADPADTLSWQGLTGKLTITRTEMLYLAELTGSTIEDMFERVFEPAKAVR